MTAALTNSELAELLARAAATQDVAHRRRALSGAAGAALRWPIAAAALRRDRGEDGGRELTELEAVGPWTAELIATWLDAGEGPDPAQTPAERRGFSSLADARARLDSDPQWGERLRGDLQLHTTWSDGRRSLEEMVAAVHRRGQYDYMAVTDHTGGLRIANGMDAERLARQALAVAEINSVLDRAGEGFRVLHGVEMNLDPEGIGDMDEAALAPLDLVLGAFHSKLRLADDQTERYCAAVRNQLIDVLAHPRTRMWDRRAGLCADWERVFAAAAESGCAVEIDGHPNRQDLDVETLRIAVASGVRLSIGSDAHHPDELCSVELALATALDAGVPADRILPFGPPEGLRRQR